MAVLRYLMLLSLIVWLGGLIFFAFVVAPTSFAVLPTRHLAGAMVNRSLGALHWMGVIAGAVFLLSSMLLARLNTGTPQPLAARHLLLYLMLVLTLISQFGISPKMAALRAHMGEIDSLATTDPTRIEFNALHAGSTRLEGGVLLLGLMVVYMVASSRLQA